MFKRQQNEDLKDYKIRLFRNKEEYNLNSKEIADLINSETGENLSESAYRKWAVPYIQGFDEGFEKGISCQSEDILKELESKKREIYKERVKNQTVLSELNKQDRIEARDELIRDSIVEAIKIIKPMKIPKPIEISHSTKKGILVYADEHSGAEFTIRGLDGEIINQYNWEIFENRMWELLDHTKDIIKKEKLEEIMIFSLGDNISGLLRISQIKLLQKGIIDSAIDYGKFMSIWIRELSECVKVTYACVEGNHDELRLLSPEKGVFPEENVQKIIKTILEITLKDNPNVEILNNPADKIFVNVCGYNILGIHGETKKPIEYVHNFSSAYRKRIDYLLAGHMHHLSTEDFARDSEVITAPSIVGIDEYAIKLLRTSNPGALLLMFEEEKGKTIEYKIKLH